MDYKIRKKLSINTMIDKGYTEEYFKFENGYLKDIVIDDEIEVDINKGYLLI